MFLFVLLGCAVSQRLNLNRSNAKASIDRQPAELPTILNGFEEDGEPHEILNFLPQHSSFYILTSTRHVSKENISRFCWHPGPMSHSTRAPEAQSAEMIDPMALRSSFGIVPLRICST